MTNVQRRIQNMITMMVNRLKDHIVWAYSSYAHDRRRFVDDYRQLLAWHTFSHIIFLRKKVWKQYFKNVWLKLEFTYFSLISWKQFLIVNHLRTQLPIHILIKYVSSFQTFKVVPLSLIINRKKLFSSCQRELAKPSTSPYKICRLMNSYSKVQTKTGSFW